MPLISDGQKAFDEAKALSEAIASSLPLKVEAAALTFHSKLPFKALSLRELLIHRVAELSGPAVDLFEQRKIVAAVVMTRSVVETVAVTYALHRALSRFAQSRDSYSLDLFLTQTLMGARWSDWKHRSTNILTLIQHVEKEVPGFEASYNALSEIAHPNWSGMLGSFGQFDQATLELRLGARPASTAFASGANALSGSLLIFNHFYNDMIPMLHEINSYFEAKGGGRVA
jgi:hypothetical protein